MTAKQIKLQVQNIDIGIKEIGGQDYICLTDISKGKEGEDHIRNWMRNRNTIEYLGLWEYFNNPHFKGVEFDTFKRDAGLNSFTMTPKKWIEATGAIGIVSFAGRYGGTYAHKDIVFNFAMWINPSFQLYIVKEYQRLKEAESNQYNLEWSVRRMLAKTNYQLHTEAVRDYVIPKAGYAAAKEWLLYAEEADMLNIALFGCTAKDWRLANPQRALAGENIRDIASINELIILANLEQANSILIKGGLSKKDRLKALIDMAREQKQRLDETDMMKSIKKLSPGIYTLPGKSEQGN